MACAEILTVGSELVEGSRVDTNAAWLARSLTKLGFKVNRICSVGDETRAIQKVIEESLKRGPKLLVLTGGLGPTPDDKTSEALARATRRKLVLDNEALELISASYKRLHGKGLVKSSRISAPRRKMALIPRGARPLPNPVGTAPALELKHGRTLVYCLPGVPAEMRSIFLKFVRPALQATGKPMATVEVVAEGIDESSLAPALKRLSRNFRVEVRSYPSGVGVGGRVRVMLVSPSLTELKKAKRVLEQSIRYLKRRT